MTSRPRALLLCAAALTAGAPAAWAESGPTNRDDTGTGDALSAIRRLRPVGPGAALSFAAGGGYGQSGDVPASGDRHHRLLGALAAEWQAHPRLHLGLRLLGRYDRTSAANGTSDDGWTGEPRLEGRLNQPLSPATVLGLALAVNLPGGKAPSIEARAIGGDLVAAVHHARGPLGFGVQLGYRVDRSANAVPPGAALSAGDRVGLGVNAFDAVLAAAGVAYRRATLTWFAEASLDALVGRAHPPARAWPLRFGLGLRRMLAKALAGELLIEAAASARPDLAPAAPLVEVPPRVSLLFGLQHVVGAKADRAEPAAPTHEPLSQSKIVEATTPTAEPEPPGEALPVGQLRCTVRSWGGAGLPATLRIVNGPANAPRPVLHSRDGNFTVTLEPGSYELTIESPHFLPQRRAITIERNGVTLLNADLRRAR